MFQVTATRHDPHLPQQDLCLFLMSNRRDTQRLVRVPCRLFDILPIAFIPRQKHDGIRQLVGFRILVTQHRYTHLVIASRRFNVPSFGIQPRQDLERLDLSTLIIELQNLLITDHGCTFVPHKDQHVCYSKPEAGLQRSDRTGTTIVLTGYMRHPCDFVSSAESDPCPEITNI